MIMTSLGCAVLAVLRYAVQPREVFTADSRHQRLPPAQMFTARAERRRGDHGRFLTILIMLLGLINAAGYLGGSRAAVLATAAVLIMATVTRLVAQYRRRRSARQARADVAHACTALASYLRVGQVPSAALPIAAADCDVLREGQQAHTPSAGTWQLYGASRRSVSGTEAFLSWRVPGRSRWCKVCDITLPRLATCDGASGRCWLGRSACGRSNFDT